MISPTLPLLVFAAFTAAACAPDLEPSSYSDERRDEALGDGGLVDTEEAPPPRQICIPGAVCDSDTIDATATQNDRNSQLIGELLTHYASNEYSFVVADCQSLQAPLTITVDRVPLIDSEGNRLWDSEVDTNIVLTTAAGGKLASMDDNRCVKQSDIYQPAISSCIRSEGYSIRPAELQSADCRFDLEVKAERFTTRSDTGLYDVQFSVGLGVEEKEYRCKSSWQVGTCESDESL